VSLPGEASAAQTVTGTTFPDVVTTVARDGVNWTYAYTNLRLLQSPEGYGYDKVVVTGPNGFSSIYNILAGAQKRPNQITSVVDALGRTTSYAYDTSRRPNQITYPEGNIVQVTYDKWGNIVSKVSKAKPGSSLADIAESAYVDVAGCAGVLCYRPVWVRDGLGR
jgi:YD repeat-containing protein